MIYNISNFSSQGPSRLFTQLAESTTVEETKKKTDKDTIDPKGPKDPKGDSSSCFNTITYPFVVIKDAIVGMFKALFNLLCCCCSSSKVDPKEEIKLVDEVIKITKTKTASEKEEKELDAKFSDALKKLDTDGLRTVTMMVLLDELPEVKKELQEAAGKQKIEKKDVLAFIKKWVNDNHERFTPQVNEILNGKLNNKVVPILEAYREDLQAQVKAAEPKEKK